MEDLRSGFLPSPWGEFFAVVTARGVCRVCFPGEELDLFRGWFQRWFGRQPESGGHPLLERSRIVLERYFEPSPPPLQGAGPGFGDLPLDLRGSDFQIAVWNALLEIPCGETVSYGEIADRLGKPPGAARAVGHAVGSNPVPVFVPCHRVLGADGRLTGFGGGLPMKMKLLQVEGVLPPGPLPESPSPRWIARSSRSKKNDGFEQRRLF